MGEIHTILHWKCYFERKFENAIICAMVLENRGIVAAMSMKCAVIGANLAAYALLD